MIVVKIDGRPITPQLVERTATDECGGELLVALFGHWYETSRLTFAEGPCDDAAGGEEKEMLSSIQKSVFCRELCDVREARSKLEYRRGLLKLLTASPLPEMTDDLRRRISQIEEEIRILEFVCEEPR